MQPREVSQAQVRIKKGWHRSCRGSELLPGTHPALALTQSLGHVVGVEDAAIDVGWAHEDARGHEGVRGDDKASPGVPLHLPEADLCRRRVLQGSRQGVRIPSEPGLLGFRGRAGLGPAPGLWELWSTDLNLTGLNLRDLNLTGLNLTGLNLIGLNLTDLNSQIWISQTWISQIWISETWISHVWI